MATDTAACKAIAVRGRFVIHQLTVRVKFG